MTVTVGPSFPGVSIRFSVPHNAVTHQQEFCLLCYIDVGYCLICLLYSIVFLFVVSCEVVVREGGRGGRVLRYGCRPCN